MFEKRYLETFSNVTASEETYRRIMNMEKKIFEQAEIEVVKFLSEDFVTMSTPESFDCDADQI